MQVLQASSQALQKEVDCGPGYSTPIVQLDVRKMIEFEPLREAPQRPRDQLDTPRQRDPSRTLYRHKISRTHVHSAFYATVKSALPPPGRLH